MDPLFELEIRPAAKGARGAARDIANQIRRAIAEGRLAPGAKLPPTRKSAAFFGVSRNTAIEIYDTLMNEGLVVAKPGSATFVATTAKRPARSHAHRKPPSKTDGRLNAFWSSDVARAGLGFWSQPSDGEAVRPSAQEVNFSPAIVDTALFPMETFRRLTARTLRELEKRPRRQRGPFGNQGSYRLRQAIQMHASVMRGLACEPDDIVVTSGAQQAFDLLARILVKSRDTVVVVEDPGYPPLRVAFAAAGATIVPCPIDREGLMVEALPPKSDIVCLSPSHQFPLGVAMSQRRRALLVSYAEACGASIVEDDYDAEFRAEGAPLKAIRQAKDGDAVFYVGTFSKCMLPALRLGYVVVPPWARDALVAAKNLTDWHTSAPLQLGVAAFIEEGHLLKHVRRMRQVYNKRRAHLAERLTSEFSGLFDVLASAYGTHVSALALQTDGFEDKMQRLAKSGVRLHSLERYCVGADGPKGAVFGFGVADVAEIDEGLARITRAFARSR